MSNRCTSCEKFVSLETAEPELQDEEMDENGGIAVSVHLTRNCADCSEEMKETTFDLEADVSSEIEDHRVTCPKRRADLPDGEPDPDLAFTLDLDDFETTERSTYGKNRKTGQENKPYYRALKTYIGVSAPSTVTCDGCGAQVADGTLEDESPASSFESLN